MRKAILIVLTCLVYLSSFAQVSYEEIESARLNSVRKLKIKLPENYDPNSEIKYPVIVVFDGDYLFEPVAGQVQFQTYFDDMPPSIIVGILQGDEREYDSFYEAKTGLPMDSGHRFHEFVETELLPYIDGKYNTSKFRVAVSHDIMGNFINSYLFKEDPAFKAYVCISPDFYGTLIHFIANRLDLFKDEIFYYMATSEKDIPSLRKNILSLDRKIKEVENPKITYYFDDFKDETHYTMVNGAIARSFDKIFEIYNPLREKELQEKVLAFFTDYKHDGRFVNVEVSENRGRSGGGRRDRGRGRSDRRSGGGDRRRDDKPRGDRRSRRSDSSDNRSERRGRRSEGNRSDRRRSDDNRSDRRSSDRGDRRPSESRNSSSDRPRRSRRK